MSNQYILKIKDFKDSYQYSYYHLPDFSRSSLPDDNITSDDDSTSSEESLRVSASRSKSLIKDFVKSNNFEYFVTITLKNGLNLTLPESVKLISTFIKKYQRRANSFFKKHKINKEFKYIYVFELTKKGAVHLHGFFSGFYDLYMNQYNHLSSLFFDKLGFQCFQEASLVNEFYLIKYIAKDFEGITKHRYFRSRNLVEPQIYTFKDLADEFMILPWTFGKRGCKMMTIKK